MLVVSIGNRKIISNGYLRTHDYLHFLNDKKLNSVVLNLSSEDWLRSNCIVFTIEVVNIW